MSQNPTGARPPVRKATLVVSLVCALPMIAVSVRGVMGELSANPIEDVTHVTGEFALRWLIVTLAITPIRRITGWAAIAPWRRTFGLAAFAYTVLHLLTWLVLDQGLDGTAIAEDLVERPYIWLGMAGFVTMVPLAATSTRASMRRLGKRWVLLHRLTYLAAVLGVAHWWWLVKADERGPMVHAIVIAVLLGLRFVPARKPA